MNPNWLLNLHQRPAETSTHVRSSYTLLPVVQAVKSPAYRYLDGWNWMISVLISSKISVWLPEDIHKKCHMFFSQEMWVILRVGWCSSRHRAFWGGLDLRTLDELEAKSPSDVENRTVETVSMLLNAAQISQILSESMKFYEDLPGVNERPLFYASREKIHETWPWYL
jgi:hypothetical protein